MDGVAPRAQFSLAILMINIAIIIVLLVMPYFVAWLFHLDLMMGGREGIFAVFLFAATGHFFKKEQMKEMLPPSVPARGALIYATGLLEIALGIAVLAVPNPFYIGLFIIAYLTAIFPSNVYAAIRRIPFGSHSMGPKYLLARLPLQLLLIWWTYWFTVKGH